MPRKSLGLGLKLAASRSSRTFLRCTKPSAGLKFSGISRTMICARYLSFGYSAENPYDLSRFETPSFLLLSVCIEDQILASSEQSRSREANIGAKGGARYRERWMTGS